MAKGTVAACAFCGNVTPLRVSHVLPAFVFKWMKATSVTGYLRHSANVNRREQDGIKRPWLCHDCEKLFGGFEREFANKVFFPILNDEHLVVHHDEWLAKFCASVAWRVLAHYRETVGWDPLTPLQEARAVKALDRWAGYIRGDYPHPGEFELHLLPFGSRISDSTVPDLPENANRYFLREVAMDIAANSTVAFTYAKLGRFILFGLIQRPNSMWTGTKVHLRGGSIGGARRYEMGKDVLGYMLDKARQHAELYTSISEAQHEKIEADALSDLDRFANSDQFRAMQADADMFGEEAILRRPKPKL